MINNKFWDTYAYVGFFQYFHLYSFFKCILNSLFRFILNNSQIAMMQHLLEWLANAVIGHRLHIIFCVAAFFFN